MLKALQVAVELEITKTAVLSLAPPPVEGAAVKLSQPAIPVTLMFAEPKADPNVALVSDTSRITLPDGRAAPVLKVSTKATVAEALGARLAS